MSKCKYSHKFDYPEGSFAIKCSIKTIENPNVFMAMKVRYETLHKGCNMACNDECEFARHSEGQIDCPYFEAE